MGFIGWIIVGGISGWIAEKFMKADHGILTNIFIGILGGIVGGMIFGILGLQVGGFLGSIVTAAIGACGIIYAYRAIRNREVTHQPYDPVMPPKDDNYSGPN